MTLLITFVILIYIFEVCTSLWNYIYTVFL